MDEKKRTSEYPENWGEYRTGSTEPPKSHGGLIAFLLIAVIFLGGIASALGLLNIHLSRQLDELESRATSPVYFSEDAQVASAEPAPASKGSNAALGFTGDAVPYFWQRYRRLPSGVYITSVEENSAAQALGITPGDILLSFDGQRIADMKTLTALLQAKAPGDSAQLLLYRNGQQIPFTLILDKE